MPHDAAVKRELDHAIRLGVCVSGGGTTLQNLFDRINSGSLSARVVQVVASKPGIGAIARAEAAGVPVRVVERRGQSLEEFSRGVFDAMREQRVELVVFGGFLALVCIPEDFRLRVLNVHPSLIPAFCGKGYHGLAVHRAVLEHGVKVTGCTVHFADDTYDTGPIILQRVVPVRDGDTPESLSARVFEAECEALPEAIRLYGAGRLAVEGRVVRVLGSNQQ